MVTYHHGNTAHPVKVRELVGRDVEGEGGADNEEEEEPGDYTSPGEDVVIYRPQGGLQGYLTMGGVLGTLF